jgi:hypothetical protein
MHIGPDSLQPSPLHALLPPVQLLQLTRSFLENLFTAHGMTPSSFMALRTIWRSYFVNGFSAASESRNLSKNRVAK